MHSIYDSIEFRFLIFCSVLIILFIDVHSRKTIDSKNRRWSFIVYLLETAKSSSFTIQQSFYRLFIFSNDEILYIIIIDFRNFNCIRFEMTTKFWSTRCIFRRWIFRILICIFSNCLFDLIFCLVDKQNIKHILRSIVWILITNNEKERLRTTVVIELIKSLKTIQSKRTFTSDFDIRINVFETIQNYATSILSV